MPIVAMIKAISQNQMTNEFQQRLSELTRGHEELIARRNEPLPETSGWFQRYRDPVLTADHAPLHWRYDFDAEANPFLLERQAVNAAFNVGAMEWNGKIVLMARVEGADRKSFFAVAESANGIDGFRFWDYPVVMPEGVNPETNVYDMRLTAHADGWIYGVFCAERKDPNALPGDLSSAVAQCGIARTRDLVKWERLDDLRTPSAQQRNCVLHGRSKTVVLECHDTEHRRETGRPDDHRPPGVQRLRQGDDPLRVHAGELREAPESLLTRARSR